MLESITTDFSGRGATIVRLLAEIAELPERSEERHLAMAALYTGLAQLEIRDAERARIRGAERARRQAARR